MKKIILFIAVVYSVNLIQGQQFSYQMYFEDAAGNKDTITLGYDLLASDSIDTGFGETNIINVPLKTGLDVRITDEWRNRVFYKKQGSYHTKNQNVFYNCNLSPFPSIQTIDIYTKHWPVTARWANLLFYDKCRSGSLITSINPGGWWDTGSPSDLNRQQLVFGNTITFTSNIGPVLLQDGYAYVNSNGDTIPVFWQVFADYTLLNVAVEEVKENYGLKAYPNPATNMISLSLNETFGRIEKIKMYDGAGRLIQCSVLETNVNISDLRPGFYFMEVINDSDQRAFTKITKM